MKEKITSAPISQFANALHTSFHQEQYNIVSAAVGADLTKWRIADLMPKWRTNIDVELDINRESTASNDTKQLIMLDQQRDQLITYLFERLRIDRLYAPLSTLKEAAARIHTTTKVYSGLQREAYQDQNVHTDGLVNDLQKTQNATDLQAVGLTAYVSQLKAVNDQFKALFSARSATKVQTQLPNARVQRPLTDALYKQVCQLLEAAYLYADTEAERERINLLVRMMNKQTEEHKARHRRATNSGSSNSNSTNKDNTGGNTGSNTGSGQWTDGTPKADGE